MALANFGQVRSENGDVYPIWIQIGGYLITGCTIIWIPIFAIWEIRRKADNSSRSLIKPTEEWGRQVQPKQSYGSIEED